MQRRLQLPKLGEGFDATIEFPWTSHLPYRCGTLLGSPGRPLFFMPRLTPLAAKFLDAFQSAITDEMEAMRERKGPSEIPLVRGRSKAGSSTDGALTTYELGRSEPRLQPGTEATLRLGGREIDVVVRRVTSKEVELHSSQAPNLNQPAVLILYPWFLYERLKAELLTLDDGRHNVELALRLFGKGPPTLTRTGSTDSATSHADGATSLNPSQQRAVRLCAESDIAFVWGPPGTGKTQTLAHVIAARLDASERVLLVSTTNAAIDQALAKLAGLSELTHVFERGLVVRIGQTEQNSFGSTPFEILERVDPHYRRTLARLRARLSAHRKSLERLDAFVDGHARNSAPVQHSLFGAPAPVRNALEPPSGLPQNASRFELNAWLLRRKARITRAIALTLEASRALTEGSQDREQRVVDGARVVIATLTNVYLSPLLRQQRFDAVVIEEGGMASLPAVFFAACQARKRCIVVGDPCQLPPIVQARTPRALRVLGRNIFQISTPNGASAPHVCMLDTQYRMHPSIGQLVSDLYYDGRITNHDSVDTRSSIASLAPFPESAVVVIDTESRTQCETGTATRSRHNDATAALCATLARRAHAAGAESVAVITPYADQAKAVGRLLQDLEAVACSTVHRFQGQERDVVIFDAVDTAPHEPGVLLSSMRADSGANNLLNVSISRARGKLILVADVAYFRSRAPHSPVTRLLEVAAARHGTIGLDSLDSAPAVARLGNVRAE